MKRLLPFLLAGTLGCLQAEAQVSDTSGTEEKKEQWYQADLIVFLNEASMNGSEKWPDLSSQLLPGDTIELKQAEEVSESSFPENWLKVETGETVSSPDITRDAYTALPYQNQLLKKQGNILDRAKGYRVLKRQSWLLSVREGEKTPAVLVQETVTDSDAPFQLQGSASVSSGRFLHIDLDLWYRELAAEGISNAYQPEEFDVSVSEAGAEDSNSDESVASEKTIISETVLPLPGKEQLLYSASGQPMKVTRNFSLKQSRKMQRLEQIQYLDTPVIGALFKLTPYEHPDEKSLLELKPL